VRMLREEADQQYDMECVMCDEAFEVISVLGRLVAENPRGNSVVKVMDNITEQVHE